MYSAVLIIPAALKAQADAVGAAMAWGHVSYTVALGPAGVEEPEITHFGCHAGVSEQFVRWVRGLDPLPDPAAQPVIDALISSFSPDPTIDPDPRPVLSARAHVDAVLAEHGLQILS